MKDTNLALVVAAALALVVLGFMGYQFEESRKAYYECLRITEKIVENNPRGVSTPYCRQ